MKEEQTLSFDAEINADVLEALIPKELKQFSLGVDYGNGDIQSIGTFELLPVRVTKIKRKKKEQKGANYD